MWRGPALGGFIAGTLGWQWVFYFGVILSLFAIAAVLVVLDGRIYSRRGSGSASFDWLGAALSTASLVTFLLVMTSGPRLGWLYPPVIGGIFALVAFVASFIWWELRCETPMIDVRLFKIAPGVAGRGGAVHIVHRQLVECASCCRSTCRRRWGFRRSRSGLSSCQARLR